MCVKLNIIPKNLCFFEQKRVLDSLFAEAISRTQQFDQFSEDLSSFGILLLPWHSNFRYIEKKKDLPKTLPLFPPRDGISEIGRAHV